MPGVYIDGCSNLKEILNLLQPLPKCNWYITDLVCYDYCGWTGCEKWAETKLFLSDDELMRDINCRDPQIVFGVFSAIPAGVPESEIFLAEEPYADGNSCYMRSKLMPQHPCAFLEITPFDAGGVYVISRDEELLAPLYGMSFDVRNEETSNTQMNKVLRRVRMFIDTNYPELNTAVCGEVQWRCWRLLSGDTHGKVSDEMIESTVVKIVETESFNYMPYSSKYVWNPYTEVSEPVEDNQCKP